MPVSETLASLGAGVAYGPNLFGSAFSGAVAPQVEVWATTEGPVTYAHGLLGDFGEPFTPMLEFPSLSSDATEAVSPDTARDVTGPDEAARQTPSSSPLDINGPSGVAFGTMAAGDSMSAPTFGSGDGGNPVAAGGAVNFPPLLSTNGGPSAPLPPDSLGSLLPPSTLQSGDGSGWNFGPAGSPEGGSQPSVQSIQYVSGKYEGKEYEFEFNTAELPKLLVGETYKAVVNWGDGATTEGGPTAEHIESVALPGNGYQIQGKHTYDTTGRFRQTAIVSRWQGDTLLAEYFPTGPFVQVENALTEAVAGQTITATAGADWGGDEPVLTFTDEHKGEHARIFTAEVQWGDDTRPTEAEVRGQDGTFTVHAKHRFPREGTFDVQVRVTDNDDRKTHHFNGRVTATIQAPVVTAGPHAFTAKRGVEYDGVVAWFNAATDRYQPAADSMSVQVDWGDNTQSVGSVVSYGAGKFAVVGKHTYAAHTYDPWVGGHVLNPVTAVLTYAGGKTVEATASATVRIGDITVTGTDVAPTFTEGVSSVKQFGTFFVDNPTAVAEDFTAVVHGRQWTLGGTGVTVDDTAIITPISNTTTGAYFRVEADPAFPDEGTYAVEIDVTSNGGDQGIGQNRALVEGAQLHPAAGKLGGAITLRERGVQFPGPSWSWSTYSFPEVPAAHFRDENPNSNAASFGAIVEWTAIGHSSERVENASVVKDAITGVYTVHSRPPSWLTAKPLASTTFTAAAAITVYERQQQPVARWTPASLITTRLRMTNAVPIELLILTPGVSPPFSPPPVPPVGPLPFSPPSSPPVGPPPSPPGEGGGLGTPPTGPFSPFGPPPPAVTRDLRAITLYGYGERVQPALPPLEGESTGRVLLAKFYSNDNISSADVHGTIDWGDGTIEPITDLVGLAVYGTHTYEVSGSYRVTVQLFDHKGYTGPNNGESRTSATATTSVLINNKPVTGAVATGFTATRGITTGDRLLLTGSTAELDLPQLRVDVDWGDGTSGVAVGAGGGDVWIVATGGGGFQVHGRHVYDIAGQFRIRVRVDDRRGYTYPYNGVPAALNPEAGTTDLAVTLSVNVLVPVTPLPLRDELRVSAYILEPLVESIPMPAEQRLGRFVIRPGSMWTPDRIMPVIDWGDGTQSEATVVQVGPDADMTFDVKGKHTYTRAGDYLLTVKVVDRQANTAGHTGDGLVIARAHTSVIVSEARLLPITSPNLSVGGAYGGGFDSVELARFTDEYKGAVAREFRVTVEWGDGTADKAGWTPGQVGDVRVVRFGSEYVVVGSHLYTAAGEYRVRVTVQDYSPTAGRTDDQRRALVLTGNASVADQPAGIAVQLAPTGDFLDQWTYDPTLFAPPGEAKFVDLRTTYEINWQDGGLPGFEGHLTIGTLLFASQLYAKWHYAFAATNAYHHATGPITVTTVFNEPGVVGWWPSSQQGEWDWLMYPRTATATREYRVAANTLGLVSINPYVRAAEGQDTGWVTLATFADQNAFYDKGNRYEATVDWGDGSTGSATIETIGDGTFRVVGQHNYAVAGRYAVGVRLTGANATTPVYFDLDALVDQPAGVKPQPTPGVVGTWADFSTGDLVLATFTDPGGTADDYRVRIEWGDDAQDRSGSVRPSATNPNVFEVVGQLTYTADKIGPQDVSVTVLSGVTGLGKHAVVWPAAYDDFDADPAGKAVWGFSVQAWTIHARVDVGTGWSQDTAWDGGNRASSDEPKVWGYLRTSDPNRAAAEAFGPYRVTANDGAVRVAHPLDFDLSPGTAVGRDPALAYNSNTASVRPIIELDLTGPLPFVPSSAAVVLTWDDQRPDGVRLKDASKPKVQPAAFFSFDPFTSYANPDPGFALAVQVDEPVKWSGLYHWSADIALSDGAGRTHQVRVGGWTPVVVRDNKSDPNAFGAGWGVAGIDRLFMNQLKDAVYVTGEGDARVFAAAADGNFKIPAEDYGTLAVGYDVVDDERIRKYVYTAKDTAENTFNNRGLLTRVETAQGLATRYIVAADGKHESVTAADGSTTSFVYSDGSVTIAQPGAATRKVELALGGAGGDWVGTLTSVKDPDYLGSSRTFSYGSRRITSDAWAPYSSTFEYSDAGRVRSVRRGAETVHTVRPAAVAALGNPAYSVPERPGAVGLLIDPRRETFVTTVTYDARGRVTRSERPLEATDRYALNSAGEVTQHTDALARVTEYTYSAGDLVRVDYPDGTESGAAFHPTFHYPTVVRDRLGQADVFDYDALGQLKSTTDREGNQTKYTYYGTGTKGADKAGLVKTVENARGYITTYHYDAHRRQEAVDNPYSDRTTFAYDVNGNPASVVDARGFKTLTEYDGRSQLRFAEDALANRMEYTYTAAGLSKERLDPKPLPDSTSRLTTRTEYDDRGFPKSTVEDAVGSNPALKRTTSYAYDAAGSLLSVDRPRAYDSGAGVEPGVSGDPARAVTSYAYDALSRPVRTIAGFGTDKAITAFTEYDRVSRVVWETHTAWYGASETHVVLDTKTAYTYDRLDRPTRTDEAAGNDDYERSSFVGYDKNGSVVRVVSPLGVATATKYDKVGRPIEVREAANLPYLTRTNLTEYDSAGKVLSNTSPTGLVTSYSYDKMNRTSQLVEAYGDITGFQRTTDYAYDKVGNLLSVASPRKYDSDRLASEDPWAVVADDKVGMVVTSYTYDKANRRVQAIEGFNLTPGTWEPTPDEAPTALLPHARPVTVTEYDALGRVTLVTDSVGSRTKTFYDGLGRKTKEGLYAPPANGTDDKFDRWTAWTYDAADNLRSVTTGGHPNNPQPHNVTSTSAYDVHNRRIGVTEAATYSGTDYGLTHGAPYSTEPPPAIPPLRTTYWLDAEGNALFTTDARGTEQEQRFDPLGRLTLRTEARNGTGLEQRNTRYKYDLEGRLVAEERDQAYPGQDGPASVRTTYGYDAFGRPTHMTAAAGTGSARTTTTAYDAADRTSAVTTPDGVTTLFTYDVLGRSKTMTEGDRPVPFADQRRTTEYRYDAADNLVAEITPRVYGATAESPADKLTKTVYKYDGLNRLSVEVRAADTPTTELGHDRPVTRRQYDLAERLVIELRPATDTSGLVPATRWKMDGLGQVTKSEEGMYLLSTKSFTSMRYETMAYDGAGNVVVHTRGTASPGVLVNGEALVSHPATTTYQYDALGRLGRQIDGIGAGLPKRVTEYRYDENGNPTLVTVRPDPSNVGPLAPENIPAAVMAVRRDTKYVYDRLDRTTSVVEAFAETAALDAVNTATLGHASPTTKTEYDAADNPVRVTDPRGSVTTFAYDAFGNAIGETRGLELQGPGWFVKPVFTYEYDKADRLVTLVGPGSVGGGTITTTFTYDAHGRKTGVTEAVGRPESRRSETEYDVAGNVIRVTNGIAAQPNQMTASNVPYTKPMTTEYKYDALGRQREATQGVQIPDADVQSQLGHSRPFTKTYYDAASQVTKVTTNAARPAAGSTSASEAVAETHYRYDELGRLTLTKEAANSTNQSRVVSAKYDAADNLLWTYSGGVPTSYAYDDLGRKTLEIQAFGLSGSRYEQRSTYTYDVWDGLISTKTPDTLTTYDYDRLGRVSKVQPTGRDAQVVTTKYDIASNKTHVEDKVRLVWLVNGVATSDANVNRVTATSYAYDPLNRLITVEQKNGSDGGVAIHNTTYDPAGRVRTVIDPNNAKREFDVDALGRPTEEHWYNPGGTASTNTVYFEFDAADHLLHSFEKKGNPAILQWGTWVKQTFDGLGRVSRVETPLTASVSSTLDYMYDAAGRTTQVKDSFGGMQRTTYDLAGRMVERSLHARKEDVSFTFTWGADPNPDAAGGRLDRLDHVHGITVPGVNGNTLPDAVQFHGEFHYDPDGRETFRGYDRPGVYGHREWLKTDYANGTRLVSRQERRSVFEGADSMWSAHADYTAEYTYTDGRQIKQLVITKADGSSTPPNDYFYDAGGNRASENQFDAIAESRLGNRIHKIGEYFFDYNADGAAKEQRTLTTSPTGGRLKWLYAYDHRDRLNQVDVYKPESTNASVKDAEVRYQYDVFDRLVGRTETANLSTTSHQTTTRYVLDGSRPYADFTDGLLAVRYLTGPGGELLARIDTAGVWYYMTDRQNSVLQVMGTQQDAAPAARTRYEGMKPSILAADGFTDRFGLGGMFFDPRAQINHIGQGRWLDPFSGRGLSAAGWTGGLNPYPAAGNSLPNAEGPGPGFLDRLLGAVGSGENAAAGMLFGARQLLDEARGGLKAVRDWRHDGPLWKRALLSQVGGGDLTWDAAFDLSIGAVGWTGVQADAYGYLAQGDVSKAAHSFGRGGAGVLRGSMLFQAMLWTNPAVWSLGGPQIVNGVLDNYGRRNAESYDESYERGLDTAAFADTLALLPLDLIPGVGPAAHGVATAARVTVMASARAAARRGATAFAKTAKFVSQTAPRVADGSKWMARVTHAKVEPLVRIGVHKVVPRVFGEQTHVRATAWAQRNGWKACFAAGTPLRTPTGSRAIEELVPGDLVLSRDEHRPDGLVTARRVEEVFVREGLVWELRLGGQTIRTTAEHPFYSERAGWTACHELQVGDRLLTEDGSWVAVEGLRDNGSWERVYNVRVADDHTYFVGCDEWGWAVWAHNMCTQAEFEAAMIAQGYSQKAATTAWNRFKLGDTAARDVQGLHKYLTGRNQGGRKKLTSGQADAIVDMVTSPPRPGTPGASPTWWDGGMSPVGGPNPNGLRQRPVNAPTPGEGGVYLKPEGGKTKVGSTDDYAGRYGRSGPDGIEIEIPQTRTGKPAGVDDSAYPWSARGQRRFDEEYVDRMLPPEVRYRDATNPKPPVSQQKWNRYRHIFGYGDLPEKFGH